MMKKVLAVVGALLLLAACGGESKKDERVTAESVQKACDASGNYLTLSSDAKAIDFNFRPGTSAQEDIYNCLLKTAGAPSSVDYKLKETRPVDGTQSTTWDGWELNWNYGGSSEGMTMHLQQA